MGIMEKIYGTMNDEILRYLYIYIYICVYRLNIVQYIKQVKYNPRLKKHVYMYSFSFDEYFVSWTFWKKTLV